MDPPSIEDAFVQASTRPGAVPVLQLMHSGMWIAAASVLRLKALQSLNAIYN